MSCQNPFWLGTDFDQSFIGILVLSDSVGVKCILLAYFSFKYTYRDLDQIDHDLSEGVVGNLLEQNIDYDKAGLGQFYCVHCA